MSKITLKSSEPPQLLPSQSAKKDNKIPPSNFNSKNTLVAYNTKTNNSPTIHPDTTPSKKAIRSNSLGDEVLIEGGIPKT